MNEELGKQDIKDLLIECIHQMEILNQELKKLYDIEDQEN